MFLGLRTSIYPAQDRAAGKAWFTQWLGMGPSVDEPFYVGFTVAGHELAPDPDPDGDPATVPSPPGAFRASRGPRPLNPAANRPARTRQAAPPAVP